MKTVQDNRPNEVLSREKMRLEPAPILVTNGTMLEYMMVRRVDAPIIQQSKAQKSLRWIVLMKRIPMSGRRPLNWHSSCVV